MNATFSQLSDNKEVMKQKREEAQDEIRNKLEEESKQRAETKREHEKLAINEMMKVSHFKQHWYYG